MTNVHYYLCVYVNPSVDIPVRFFFIRVQGLFDNKNLITKIKVENFFQKKNIHSLSMINEKTEYFLFFCLVSRISVIYFDND